MPRPKKADPSAPPFRKHVPVTVSERLHFLVKTKLITRPRVVVRGAGKNVTRKVTMHRFLEWLVVSALESRGFDTVDAIARDERVPLRHAVKMVYAFAAVEHQKFRAFLRRNRPATIEELGVSSAKSPGSSST